MIGTVSGLMKAMTLVALAFWGLATMHCDLEQLPGFEFLNCCQHEETIPHQDNDCAQDGCATIESGFYKLEEQPAAAPEPLLLLGVLTPLWEQPARRELPAVTPLSSSPPELPQRWQFSYRTALPPRAPSFAG
jgi:hypothetical protein